MVRNQAELDAYRKKCQKRKSNEWLHSTESYAVKFWIERPDGFMEQREEMYFCGSKSGHDRVVKRWQDDYRGQKVRLIHVTYE